MDVLIRQSIAASIETKRRALADAALVTSLANAIQMTVDAYRTGGGFLAVGNGGSAADAQHIVAELVGRFYFDRAPLRAHAFTSNSSNVTCIGNDYGYEEIFARQVWANGKRGDILLAISTSGNSKNVILAVEKAKSMGIRTIALTGESGGRLAELCDVALRVPSRDTARIQECHIMLGHILCERVEAELFAAPSKANVEEAVRGLETQA